jgi:hypothetical protein
MSKRVLAFVLDLSIIGGMAFMLTDNITDLIVLVAGLVMLEVTYRLELTK